MESKKGLKAPEKLCIIGSLPHFFQNFDTRILFADVMYSIFKCFYITQNAFIQATIQNSPVRSSVAIRDCNRNLAAVKKLKTKADGIVPEQRLDKPITWSLPDYLKTAGTTLTCETKNTRLTAGDNAHHACISS